MANARIYGPIRGAGTQVREQTPERNITPGTLGATVFVGAFERGVEDDISICPSKKSLLRKMGGLLDPADFNAPSFASLEAPLNAQHFWDHSDGAGYQVNLRVVPKTGSGTSDDHTPDKATLPIFNRESSPKYVGLLTAQNGGRWAGQRKNYHSVVSGTPGTDFPSANTVKLVMSGNAPYLKADEFKNGTLHLHGITTKTYKIVGHDSAGLITLEAGETVDADWTAASVPATGWAATLIRSNLNYRGDEKSMSVEWKDGTLDPAGLFGVTFYINGDVVRDYENLSMDTASPKYWVNVINDDPNNDFVTVTDSFTGSRSVSTARPANRYGLSKTLTGTALTIADPEIYSVSSASGDWVPTITFNGWGSSVVPQTLTVTVTNDAIDEITVSTDAGQRVFVGTLGSAFIDPLIIADDEYTIDITVNAGTGTYADGDSFTVYVQPLEVNELAGGKVIPDTSSNESYTIISNTSTTVTVASFSDMTLDGSLSGGEEYKLQWPERMYKGYDGYLAGMVTADYEALLDAATSPLKKLKSMNLGLVKMSIPGIAKPSEAVALQQKIRDLALAYNWQYRVEVPDEYLAEEDVLTWVNNTYGRLDLTVTFFPSFMYIRDPLAIAGSDASEQLVSVTGMQLGREAKVAREWNGYHKAEAGVDVTLPLVTRAPVLGRPDNASRINEEFLNPAGVNAYRWNAGGTSIIAWGDKTLDDTTAFRYKHKREQLSHYMNILQENFDWAIFQINDPISDTDVLAAIHQFFLGEFRNRAIRGDTFVGGTNPSAIIKMDSENNTNATRAAGDQNVDISLRFADVVERLKISVGAMGITATG